MLRRNIGWRVWCASVVALPIVTFGVRPAWSDDQPTEAASETAPGDVHYRIGLVCAAVPRVLRAHLDLPDDQGVLVQRVVEDGAAEKAGIEQHDVLVSVDGVPLRDPGELARLVRGGKGQPQTIGVYRKGQLREVSVTATATPPRNVDWWPGSKEELRDMVRQRYSGPMIDGARRSPLRFRRRGPMALFQGGEPGRLELPHNTSVRIETDDAGKTHLHVQHDGEEYDVTTDGSPEEVVQKLPSEVQPIVRSLLAATRSGRPAVDDFLFAPGHHLPFLSSEEVDLDFGPIHSANGDVVELREQIGEMRRQIEKVTKELKSWQRQMQKGHLVTPPASPDPVPEVEEIEGV